MTAHVQMCRDGVSVVLDLTAGQLPAIVHWGHDLGALSAEDVSTLALVGVRTTDGNPVDVPVRLALLPQQDAGWAGRPGLSGHRTGGTDWSPHFVTTSVTVDGAELPSRPEPSMASGTVVVVTAEDRTAGLTLTIEIELCAGGLLRSRASLTNIGETSYELDELVLAYPVPPVATQLLDFVGRWALERIPQRSPFSVGSHVREGRKGRTGPDAATVLHAQTPGTSFREGEAWGVHVGWSGNHTHYAERLWTGEQVIGGGELLLPGEVTLGAGESYTSPWLYGTYGRGLDECAGRFHQFLRARPNHHLHTTARHAERLGGRVLRPRPPHASRARRHRRGSRCRAVRARRRLVRLPPRRHSGLGDWTVSPRRLADGLHPLVDHVTGLGMQFGLWFEPEMVNLDSDVARAHPDWVMGTGGRTPLPSRSPAGDQPRHPRVLRLHPRRDLRDARRVRHQLHQVGPQPRPRRRR
jgi:alpha-galactosidase